MATSSDQFRYNHPLEQWEQAREEMRRILISRARQERTIAYSDLVAEVHAVKLEPNDFALAAMLGEISEEEDPLGRGMLTVLVVHKDGDMRPGPGFFQLAKKLDRDTIDIDRCWVDEFKRVVAVWKDRSGER